MIKRILVAVAVVTLAATFLAPPKASAITGSEWRAGQIIDDSIFFNSSAMSANDVQAFLNAQVPSCDTWGQKMYSTTQTRAQRGTSKGVPPPYVCLKDYRENPTTKANNLATAGAVDGGWSASQIIKHAADTYNVSPKALIVLLQKEQGLVTDEWPWPGQYRSATGYGCPDTAPCDAEYYGFYNQVINAAKAFRRYATYPQNYRYKAGQDNFVQYNPDSGCSGTNVFIQNQASAGLYIYTPYQPNVAALNNLYGTGDSCSAYGNRNFWRMYNDWFGPTYNERLYYKIVRSDVTGMVYLQTYAGKYYVPSYDLLAEWGYSPTQVTTIQQYKIDLLPSKGTLGNALTDGYGKLYAVEGGNLHEVSTSSHAAIWQVDTSRIVESLGMVKSMPIKAPLGRFMIERNGNDEIWLVDGKNKHLMSSGQLLYAWGYYPGTTTVVSSYFFNQFAEKRDSSIFASTPGGETWLIEASKKRPFKNKLLAKSYLGDSLPMSVSAQVVSLLQNGEGLGNFTINTSTGQWFLIDRGYKRYIPKGELATLWGKQDNDPLTHLSNVVLDMIPTAPDLTYVARSASSPTYWLIAKNKMPIPNFALYYSLTGSNEGPDIYSDELLNTLATSSQASYSIKSSQSPYNYTYIVDKGVRHYPNTPAAQSAWIHNPITVPVELMRLLPEGSFIGNVVTDNSGASYYLENHTKYPISSNAHDSWNVNSNTIKVSSETLNEFGVGQAVGSLVKSKDGKNYIISFGKKIPAVTYRDIIESVAKNSSLDFSGLETTTELSFLVSTKKDMSEIWLISKGERIALPLFEQKISLGYLSNSVHPTLISTSALESIPVSSQKFSLLIQKNGSGIKFLNFGKALGFPDSETLLAYINSSSTILNLSASVFDSFSLSGSVSRVVYDDRGRYWWVNNGNKSYITSWNSYRNKDYPSVTPKYLYGTTMVLIPESSPI